MLLSADKYNSVLAVQRTFLPDNQPHYISGVNVIYSAGSSSQCNFQY